MSKHLIARAEELTRKAASKRAEAAALADKEGGLSAAETTRATALMTEADGYDAESTSNRNLAESLRGNREKLDGYSAPGARQTAAPDGEPLAAKEKFLDDPMRGFSSGRSFFVAVQMHSRGAPLSADLRARLKSLQPPATPMAAAGSDEQGVYSDPAGGFMVPKGMLPGVKTVGFDPDPIAPLTQKIPMQTVKVGINARVDKDHSSSVSGGLQVYRRSEISQVTATRMLFEQVELTADELMGVAYATDLILRASPESFAAILDRGFRDEYGAKGFSERLDANGVGKPLGVNNADCKIDVAKETNQPARSIVYKNLVNMRARCWNYGAAVWLANHDCLPELLSITAPGSTVPLFSQAAGGIPDLFGRPIFFSEFMKTVGTVGDLQVGVWSEYLEGEYAPIENVSSIHVRFLEAETCFRFWKMNGGAPWWRTVLTPKNGATLAPFVRLATRA